MPGRSRRRGQDRDLDQCTPDQDDGGGWGSGFFADLFGGGGDICLDDSGTFDEAMYDLGRQLGQSGVGTVNSFEGTREHETDFVESFGIGGGIDGGLGPLDFGLGAGLGGSYEEWHASNTNREGVTRDVEGTSLGLGMTAREDRSFEAFDQEFGYGGELYRGLGGGGYAMQESDFIDMAGGHHGASSGYGIEGQYTPFGVNNAYAETDTFLGSSNVSVENMVFGAQRASLEGFSAEDGTYGARGSWAPGRTEINGVHGEASSALGDTEFSLGSFGQGARYEGEAWANPNGSFGFGAQKGGDGASMIRDAHLNHQFGEGGPELDASLGSFSNGSSWAFGGGWDNEAQRLSAQGNYKQGMSIKDAEVGLEGDGYGAHASLGEFNNGMNFKGDASWSLDEGLNAHGGGTFGGWGLRGASADAEIDGLGSYEASVGSLDYGRTIVEGAELNAGANGIDARLGALSAGGFNARDMRVREEFLGMEQEATLGELSNDTRLNGAYAHLGLTEGEVGFEDLDYGGVRVNDFNYAGDFGEAGDLSAHMGSLSTGDSIKDARLGWSEDGIDAHVGEAGLFGALDIEDAMLDYEGPAGLYANAGLEKLHTGLTVNDFDMHADLDGISASAKHADYYGGQLEGVDLAYGMEGVFDSSAHLGEGHYNKFSGDNLHAGLDWENGLTASGDNLEYSYLGLEDLHTRQSIGDGMIGTSLDLERGSALGGSADHAELQSRGLMGGSLDVEGLNAHGLQLEGLDVNANVGDLGYGFGADQLNALDLNVGRAHGEYGAFYSSGNASVEDAQLDVLNAKGMHGGLSWGEEEMLGYNMDLRAGLGVDNAQGEWDLMSGTAGGSFENLHSGAQLSNASVNLFGNELEIPDMGYNMNASGSGNVDVLGGKADAALSLAGSSVNFAGHELELGDWAQASAGMDLSQGAARFNLGGDDGLGADMSLWGDEGPNLDLNLFGNEVDVDEGIADAADWVGDTAGETWDAVSEGAGDAWDWAGDTAGDAMDSVGEGWDAVTDAADMGWDVVSSTAGEGWDAVTDLASDGVDTVSDWAVSALDTGTGMANDAWDATTTFANDAWDTAGDAADWVGDTAGQAWDTTSDAVGGAADWVGDRAGDAAGWVGDTAGDAWDAAGSAASYVASLLPSVSLW